MSNTWSNGTGLYISGDLAKLQNVRQNYGKNSVLLESHNAQYFAQAQAQVTAGGTLGGNVVLDGGEYLLPSTGWNVEAGLINIQGNNSSLNISGVDDANPGLLLTNTLGDNFPRRRTFNDFQLTGDIATGRAGNKTGIRVNSAPGRSVRAELSNVDVRYVKTGVSIGSAAYFLVFDNFQAQQCNICVRQESGAADNKENVVFLKSYLFNSDTLLQDNYGQIFRMYGCSLDFGGTLVDVNNTTAGHLELYGCHIEFDYGKNAGETNCPIRIAGNTAYHFKMFGGAIFYNDGTNARNPAWPALFQTASQNHMVLLRDVRAVSLGRIETNRTAQDCLSNPVSDQAGIFIVQNLHSTDFQLKDLPAAIGYRNSIDTSTANSRDPYLEFMHRTSWSTANYYNVTTTQGSTTATVPSTVGMTTGQLLNGNQYITANTSITVVDGTTITLSAAASGTGTASTMVSTVAPTRITTTDNSVVPNSSGAMWKIPAGCGVVRVALKNYDPRRRLAWSMFTNGSAAVGNVYIREMFASGATRVRQTGEARETAKTVTAITKASPGTVTSAAHGFANGDKVIFTIGTGMTELNNVTAIIGNVTTNTFDLLGVNTTSYTTFTSGTVTRIIGVLDLDVGRDTRTLTNSQYAPAIAGTNEWRRVSWKDCNTSAVVPRQQGDDVVVVEINTLGMTSGALYIDDFVVDPI